MIDIWQMASAWELASAWLVGVLLGAIFFGGLWWTVRAGVTVRHVALWFFGSMLLRTSMVVLGFYFMLGSHWQRLLAGLLGFVVVRLMVTRRIRAMEPSHSLSQEVDRAH